MTKLEEALSLNRAPCDELVLWVARIFAADVDTPDDHLIDCGLCADTPILRMLFRGRWTAKTRYGVGAYERAAALFGVTPHKFRAQPRPLLTVTLEQRQARRLEGLKRLRPVEHRPWLADLEQNPA
ncbi:MAG: hypothetical protein O3C52_05185 [Proteobacteria bacterium]|nr:hypothetical protein [Pseudomonadota bacterium]MDA0914445.1 hypothetical protein [Pseudomonadota bacterium]MDA1032747.1 hypothetical protein [Pseudomonadota bacterium]